MKTRVCDICNEPMSSSYRYFKIKCEGISGYKKIDVCPYCFEKFKEFANDKIKQSKESSNIELITY